jgi:hypothetical protein
MPETVTRELRFDLRQGDLSTRRRTPQGGLIVDANISRVGVFKYQNADGSERRELRTPDEVFSARALDSFAHAPLTVEHPPGLVTPETWKQVTVGHVAGPAQKDGKFVGAELHIQDKATIDRIERGELVELSCGYQCRLDMTPGTHPEFGEYDAKQTDIFGNHVAMGPKNWGRAGPDVKMHVDSAGEHVSVGSYVPRMSAGAKPKPKTRTDGRAAVRTPEPANDETREDELDEEEIEEEPEPTPRPRARPGARVDRLEGENEQLRRENERLRADKDKRTTAQREAEEQARIDARVNARVDLIAKVAPILTEEGKPAFRGDGLTEDEIRRKTLAVLEPDLKLDGRSADYVIGVFDSAIARADRVKGGWRELGDVLRPEGREGAIAGGTSRGDGKPPKDGEEDETVEDAQGAMVAKQKDAWKMGKDKRDRGSRDKRDRGGRR